MNTRTLIATAALTFAAAGSAFAQEVSVEPRIDFSQSTIARAEVRADAVRALSRGDLRETAQINPRLDVRSELSRDTVRTATLKAQAGGRLSVQAQEAFNFG